TAHVFPAGGTNTIDLDVSEASAAASVLRPCSLRSCACIAQSWPRRKFVPARRAVRNDSRHELRRWRPRGILQEQVWWRRKRGRRRRRRRGWP
ncbi:unnamed protein product, partial [Pylaiella littoralis]